MLLQRLWGLIYTSKYAHQQRTSQLKTLLRLLSHTDRNALWLSPTQSRYNFRRKI